MSFQYPKVIDEIAFLSQINANVFTVQNQDLEKVVGTSDSYIAFV